MKLPTPYYADDSVTLYHGDSYELLPLLHGSCDALITDPPYGMSFTTGKRCGDGGWTSRWTGVSIAGDSDLRARDFALTTWGTERPALVFGTWKSPLPEGVREVLIWDKVVSTGMGALDIPWRPSWEAIFVIGRGFVGNRSHGVIRCSMPTLSPERKLHPTPKPEQLMRELVAKCPQGTILDPFMGSGPVARAAKDLGRRFIGIEIEERYIAAAAARCRQEVLL